MSVNEKSSERKGWEREREGTTFDDRDFLKTSRSRVREYNPEC